MLTTAEQRREQHRWGMFFVLLPLLGVALLAFVLFFQTTAFATPQLVHVSLRSMLNANYQVDPHPVRVAALSLNVVADSLQDERLDSSSARARLDALAGQMQTPVTVVSSASNPAKAIVSTTPEAMPTSAQLRPEPRDPPPSPALLPSPAPPPPPPTAAPTVLPPAALQTAVPTPVPATTVRPTLPAATLPAATQPPPTTAPQVTPATPLPEETDGPLPRRTRRPTAEPKSTKEPKPSKESGTPTPFYKITPAHENRLPASNVLAAGWHAIPSLNLLAAWPEDLLLR